MATRSEFEEAILDVLAEYLPGKAVTKPVRQEIVSEIVTELEERGLVEVEEEEYEEDEDADAIDELVF